MPDRRDVTKKLEKGGLGVYEIIVQLFQSNGKRALGPFLLTVALPAGKKNKKQTNTP